MPQVLQCVKIVFIHASGKQCKFTEESMTIREKCRGVGNYVQWICFVVQNRNACWKQKLFVVDIFSLKSHHRGIIKYRKQCDPVLEVSHIQTIFFLMFNQVCYNSTSYRIWPNQCQNGNFRKLQISIPISPYLTGKRLHDI